MNVKFLGQACTLIETGGKRILCDPWITGTCNVNSWYHLNRRIQTRKDIPTDVDYIYISHEGFQIIDIILNQLTDRAQFNFYRQAKGFFAL